MAVIVMGRFGWLEVQAIITAVTIAGASILGLACGVCLEQRSHPVLPTIGIALATISASLIILSSWFEVGAEGYWKTTLCSSFFAVACTHLSLLSMARLSARFRWSLVAAFVIILGLASLGSAFVVLEVTEPSSYRLLGAVAIADAAITFLVPIFHRLSRSEMTAVACAELDLVMIDIEIAVLQERLAGLQQLKRAHLQRQAAPLVDRLGVNTA